MNKDCHLLSSNYENYPIPVEIPENRIEEYRQFFLDEIDIYKRSIEVFMAHVELRFGIIIQKFDAQESENSGLLQQDKLTSDMFTILIKTKENIDLLKNKDNHKFNCYKFMPYHKLKEKEKRLKNKGDWEYASQLSTLKYTLRETLINYLIQLYFKNEMEFQATTLISLGAQACPKCCK